MNIMNIPIPELKSLTAESYSRYQILKRLKISVSGQHMSQLQTLLLDNKIDTSHFQRGIAQRKYKRITKQCPVCGILFETQLRSGRRKKTEKTVCSRSCAGTWFKTGKDNPNWKGTAYRKTAFLYHGKKCLICNEPRILEVHHLDHDRNNNAPENLIPLCPTHHKYMHSKYKLEISVLIATYFQKRGTLSKVSSESIEMNVPNRCCST